MTSSAAGDASVTTWVYDMKIPDDTPDEELAAYREIAVSLWRTSSETLGGWWKAEPTATLVMVENPATTVNPVTGETVEQAHRAWHIEGAVT